MFTQHEVLTAEYFQLSLWIIYIYSEQRRVAQIALKRKVDRLRILQIGYLYFLVFKLRCPAAIFITLT